MAEFKRSRLVRNAEDQITRKTVVLGLITLILFILMIIFGLPFLVRFSIFLGESKSNKDKLGKELVLPPLPPRLIIPFEATNSAKIEIKGLAESNVEVELLKNDVSVGTTQVSQNGDFAFINIELDKGDNTFSAIAKTEKGGSSEPSKPIVLVYDDQAPEMTMINPSEDSLTVDYLDFDIVGKTDKAASVLINGRVAMVDDEGKFKLKVQLNAGKNDIEIVSKDLAGNETKKKISITYDI